MRQIFSILPKLRRQATHTKAGFSVFSSLSEHPSDFDYSINALIAIPLYLAIYAECVIFSSEQCRGAADRAADAESPNVPMLPMSIRLECLC
jgi:hypothetical protein